MRASCFVYDYSSFLTLVHQSLFQNTGPTGVEFAGALI